MLWHVLMELAMAIPLAAVVVRLGCRILIFGGRNYDQHPLA